MKKKAYIFLGILLFSILILVYFKNLSDNKKEQAFFIELQEFNNLIQDEKELIGIGIFPQNSQYVTVNNITIDLENKTYGKNPKLGFVREYYEAAKENKIEKSIQELLNTEGMNSVSEFDLLDLKQRMEHLGLSDVFKSGNNSNDIMYYMQNSMWGRNGFIFTQNIEPYKNEKNRITKTKSIFYKFTE